MELEKLKKNVAQNIYFLRTANNMTQSELGAKLNYSDKAISKWERGEGLPDAFVLTKLGEIFGVTVDYLLNEHTEQDRRVDTTPIKNTKRLFVQTLIFGMIAVAVLVCVILYLSLDTLFWQMFIYSLPVVFTVLMVFSFVWWHGKGAFVCTSLLLWSVISTVYVAMISQNNWQLFLVGIPAQITVFMCYKTGFAISLIRKTSSIFKRKSENGSEGTET